MIRAFASETCIVPQIISKYKSINRIFYVFGLVICAAGLKIGY